MIADNNNNNNNNNTNIYRGRPQSLEGAFHHMEWIKSVHIVQKPLCTVICIGSTPSPRSSRGLMTSP